MRIVFLNSPILTCFGEFSFREISLKQVKVLLSREAELDTPLLSAVGHSSTAELLSSLLGFPVPVNRIKYIQQENDLCIVFFLPDRLPEGKTLSLEDLSILEFKFGLLTKEEAL